MSPFTAVLDAKLLHSQPLTNLLLELAVAGLYRPAWSTHIHAEWRRSVLRVRPDVNPSALDRRRAAMDAALPDVCIGGYAPPYRVSEPAGSQRSLRTRCRRPCQGSEHPYLQPGRDFPVATRASFDSVAEQLRLPHGALGEITSAFSAGER